MLDKIPTISTQLKIIATVKATRSGSGECFEVNYTSMLDGQQSVGEVNSHS